jgi:hypothetical protein
MRLSVYVLMCVLMYVLLCACVYVRWLYVQAWMEFRAYLAARLREEHIVVHVPAAR